MNQNYYKRWWIFVGVPLTVVLATFIGTPHTLFDSVLYIKIGLNLFIGGTVWWFYYRVILYLDRKLPWESANSMKRWFIQLGICLPPSIIFNWIVLSLRNQLINWPFSLHLFVYTDIPVIILFSIAIHFLYYQAYLNNIRKQAVIKKTDKASAFIAVKIFRKTYMVPIAEVAYFYREDEINLLRKWNEKELIIDHSLGAVERLADKKQFFRVNRQLLVNRKAIISYKVLNTRHIELQLKPELKKNNLLNKNRFKEFKKWLNVK